jgi:hypothetical protein
LLDARDDDPPAMADPSARDSAEPLWPAASSLDTAAALDYAASARDGDDASPAHASAVNADALPAREVLDERWTRPLIAPEANLGGEAPTWPATARDKSTSLPSSEQAVEAPEPVFMYQMDTMARHEPVRVAPPPVPNEEAPWDIQQGAEQADGQGFPLFSPSPHRELGTGAEGPTSSSAAGDLALLGPALASGLADLLRERPPHTRPRSAEVAALRANEAAAASLAPAPLTPRVEHAGLDTPQHDPSPLLWADPYQEDARLSDDELLPFPESASRHLQQAFNGIRESTSTTPTAAYVTTPSQRLRRRVVQRVIVRKMAVVDGRVVAESTVERQVQVVRDEDELAERIHAATNEAAREALQHLIAQAPEEALPAIRLQLYALDNARSVDNFQGNGVLNGVRG